MDRVYEMKFIESELMVNRKLVCIDSNLEIISILGFLSSIHFN